MSRPVLVIAAATTLLMGCILRDFDYEPPANHWPSVENLSTGQTPLNQIVEINLNDPIGGDGGVPNEQLFEVIVRDDDVTQPLEGRVYLDNMGLQEVIIPAEPDSPEPRRRTVRFFVPRSRIAEGCRLVELVVSTKDGFGPFPSRTPLETSDIASAQWWIAASLTGSVDMDLCPVGQ